MATEALREVPAPRATLWNVISRTYDLGFTAFGGPPVHFQIFHQRFVHGDKPQWVDEQTVGNSPALCGLG